DRATPKDHELALLSALPEVAPPCLVRTTRGETARESGRLGRGRDKYVATVIKKCKQARLCFCSASCSARHMRDTPTSRYRRVPPPRRGMSPRTSTSHALMQ